MWEDYEYYEPFKALFHINLWLLGPNTLAPKRLRRNDSVMIRYICGTKVQDEIPSDSLLTKLGMQSFAVGGWNGMNIYIGPRPVTNLSQTYRFPNLEGQEGLEMYGINMSRLVSRKVTWLALTRKTETHGDPVLPTPMGGTRTAI